MCQQTKIVLGAKVGEQWTTFTEASVKYWIQIPSPTRSSKINLLTRVLIIDLNDIFRRAANGRNVVESAVATIKHVDGQSVFFGQNDGHGQSYAVIQSGDGHDEGHGGPGATVQQWRQGRDWWHRG